MSASTDPALPESVDFAISAEIADALPHPLLVLDERGHIAYANTPMTRICNLTGAQMHGRTMEEILNLASPDSDADQEDCLEHTLLASHQSTTVDCLLCPRQGDCEGSRIPVRLNQQMLADGHRLLAFTLTGQEVNLRQQLEHQTYRDRLTGLYNRLALENRLAEVHAQAESGDGAYTLILIDIDRFKLINDNFGHKVGDEALISIPDHAMDQLRPGDQIGRWSGHEFLCILPDTSEETARAIAEQIRQTIYDSSTVAEGRLPSLTISAGVAGYRGQDHFEAVLTAADIALYEAKRGGRNRVRIAESARQGVFLAGGELQKAIHERRLIPAFQPIVDLKTGEIVADEALARIRTPDDRLMAAGAFIDAASQLQLAHRIDHEIILQTINYCGSHLRERPISHFVNISTDLLRHPRRVNALLEHARSFCTECGLDEASAKPLVIEITERELLTNAEEALEALKPFLDFGLRLAIDDFGSGYSSFQYLADLPVDFLKIEGELIRRAPKEPRIRAIVEGIQDIASSLGVQTIAEFVEDEATVELLKELGVDWAQGYYFGRPQTLDEAQPPRAEGRPDALSDDREINPLYRH